MYYGNKKYNEAEKYYLQAIEIGDDDALYNLGIMYYVDHKYDEAEKYLLLSEEKKDTDAKYALGILYYKLGILHENDTYMAYKYFISGALRDNYKCIDKIKNNQLAVYLLHPNKYKIIRKFLDNQLINIIQNKLTNFSRDGTCNICFENTKLIPYECCHFVCVNCFVKIRNKCPECNIEFMSLYK
jgi:tetratricopeptide (TPR) repeat protein